MKRIIFFDGVCTLCNRSIDFILKKNHIENPFYFASLQSDYAKKHVPVPYQSLDTIVLMEGEKVYTKSTAALRILFALGGHYSILSMLVSIFPRFVTDIGYDFIANNRYRLFGKKDTCRIPTAAEKTFFLE